MSADIDQQDVDQALREIDVLVDRIGDQVTDTISGQTDQGANVTGRQVQHGNLGYQVLAPTGDPYLILRCGFDAAEALAANKESDGTQPVQPNPAAVITAKNELRSEFDDETLGDIREGLISRISTGDLAVQLNADGVFTTGFQLKTRLFPYDQDVTVSEFYDGVQSLISAMWRGKVYLVHAYNLRDAIEGDDGGFRGYQ